MNRDDVLSIVRQFTGHENIIALDCINWTDFQEQINELCKGANDGK